MTVWSVVSTACFTAIFYYWDLKKKCDIKYFSHLPYWGLSTVLGKYLLIYFLAGAVVTIVHGMGFEVFRNEKSPLEQLSFFITPGQTPPRWATQIALGAILAYTIRLFFSTKAIPLISTTIDSWIDEKLFPKLENEQRLTQLRGKNAFINQQLKRYQKNYDSNITVNEFGRNLISYLSQLQILEDPKNVALVRDVSDSKDDIQRAIRICLPSLTRREIKSILFLQDNGIPVSNSPGIGYYLRGRKIVVAGIFSVFLGFYFGGIYLFPDDVSNEKLDEVETNFFIPFTREKTTNQILVDFYVNSNSDLIDSITSLSKRHTQGLISQGSIFISAPAGEGKTTFVEHIENKLLKNKVVDVNFENLFYSEQISFSESQGVSTVSSRHDSTVYFGRTFSLSEKFNAKKFLRNHAPTFSSGFIIVDEIDLLDEASARTVIQEFINFANTSKKFIYVIFVLQPDVLNEFLNRISYTSARNYYVYSLQDVRFNKFDDLKIRVNEYKTTHRQRWDHKKVNEICESLMKAINADPYLSYSIQNLYVGNEIISRVASSDGAHLDLKKEIYDNLLDRAHQKFSRPNSSDNEQFGLYQAILMCIAAKYFDTESDGSFKIRHNDRLAVGYRGDVWSFNVQSILNRSGLVTVTPEGKYRFSPFWLHSYLIQQYNYQGVEVAELITQK
jgi:hypothetical protein